jgi:hypothetical protein
VVDDLLYTGCLSEQASLNVTTYPQISGTEPGSSLKQTAVSPCFETMNSRSLGSFQE